MQQAAFEVIFAYNEDTGGLDDFMHGDKNLRRDLEEIFCRIVLKEKLPDTDPRRPPYQIDAVRKANIDFPTNPEDKIRETRVKFLRLSIVGPGFGRITFESDAWRKKGDIHELMKTYLNADSVSTTRLRKRHP